MWQKTFGSWEWGTGGGWKYPGTTDTCRNSGQGSSRTVAQAYVLTIDFHQDNILIKPSIPGFNKYSLSLLGHTQEYHIKFSFSVASFQLYFINRTRNTTTQKSLFYIYFSLSVKMTDTNHPKAKQFVLLKRVSLLTLIPSIGLILNNT